MSRGLPQPERGASRSNFRDIVETYRKLRHPIVIAELKLDIVEQKLKNIRLNADLKNWKALALDLDSENEALQNQLFGESHDVEVRQPQYLINGGIDALEREFREFLDRSFFQKGQ